MDDPAQLSEPVAKLRISQNLTSAQVQAEHRLLVRLARSDLPFAVPAPVPLPDGSTIVGTSGGPATLCQWIPGVRPDLSQESALETFGQAVAQLSDALRSPGPVRVSERPRLAAPGGRRGPRRHLG